MYLLTNFLTAIPIPDKSEETVIQAYLQHIYVTFSGSIALVTGNGEEQF